MGGGAVAVTNLAVHSLGPYRLVRRLGMGGMGETYEARTLQGAVVCLKTIRPELASNARYVRMFQEEARIHAQLSHQNIVRVLDSGEHEGVPFLALEMVDGLTLDTLLAYLTSSVDRAPVAASAHILLSLARALEAAHGFTIAGKPQNLVHRDISPSNVLISRAGEVKLSDFGIAKALCREPHTTAGVVRGKLSYMAPEQTRGEPLDHRGDLFALGVIAYELLAGSHPYRGDRDESEVMTAHRMLLDQRAPLVQRAPGIVRAVHEAVEELLAREPSARPSSALALAKALEGTPNVTAGKLALQRLVSLALSWSSQRSHPAMATHALPMGGSESQADLSVVEPRASPSSDVRERMKAGVTLLNRYLSALPSGLASYPSCRAKGSLMRAFLAAKPVTAPADCPEALRDLISHPPVTGAWIPEVTFLAVALLVREQHFTSDDQFLAWVKELNAELFRGPLYRMLMRVSTTHLLAAGAEIRWRQFHEGTKLIARHGKDASMELSFRFPHDLFSPLHVRLFASAVEAAVEAAGGVNAKTASVQAQASGADARIVWSTV